MALPKIDSPIFELTLPLSKKQIRFKPFTVKEQRNLLMALESADKDTMEKNVKQVLHNCTLTEGIDIDKLPVVDVEYFFIQLRARSVGEIVHNKYRCENVVDGNVCNHAMEVDIDLTKIEVIFPEDVLDTIQLTDRISIKFNYPEYSIIEKSNKFTSTSDMAFNMILDCVDYIFDGDQFHYAKETPRKELNDFIESLNQEQFSKIEGFFENLPVLKSTIAIKCKKCGFEHKIEVEGIEDFFA
jgi:hypothetical protein